MGATLELGSRRQLGVPWCELGNASPPGDFSQDCVLNSVGFVIFLPVHAQFPRFPSDDGIEFEIERLGAVKDLDASRLLHDPVLLPSEGPIDYEFQKAPRAAGGVEDPAGGDLVKLIPNFRGTGCLASHVFCSPSYHLLQTRTVSYTISDNENFT